MRQGMDFFDSQHPFFNQNQTLNRQRFPTINRRAQTPMTEEWFRRGGGSVSPSQIRRHNLQQQQYGEPRGDNSDRAPGSPGQSRRIPIMVADGQGGFRTLEKDRNLAEERNSPSSPSRHQGEPMFERQSLYNRQPQQMDTSSSSSYQQPHHLDRQTSRDSTWSPPQRMSHQRQQRGGFNNRVVNDSEEIKPKTFNIPIQIEGQGRECFVKDEPPSEDEGYSQDDCSSQTEDENRNITDPKETAAIIKDNYKNVKNMPRFVSEAHFPTLRREEEERRKNVNSDGIVNFVNNEDKGESKKSGQIDHEKFKQLPEADYPFPEVSMPTDRKDEKKRDAQSVSSTPEKERTTSPSEKEKDERTPIPMPAPPAPDREDSNPSGSEKESAKSSDSETDSQSAPQVTPLEKIAKIASSIAELGRDVQRFEGREKTKEYRRIEEYLMRALLSLDKIDTQGDVTIRTERKKAVQSAQTYLSQLEKQVKK